MWVYVVCSNSEKEMFFLLAFITASILIACTGGPWTKEGANQNIMIQDLESCEAISKTKGRTEFPEILVYSSMEFEGYSSLQDINLENFSRAKIQYQRDCMLDRGYHIE